MGLQAIARCMSRADAKTSGQALSAQQEFRGQGLAQATGLVAPVAADAGSQLCQLFSASGLLTFGTFCMWGAAGCQQPTASAAGAGQVHRQVDGR